AQPLEFAGLQRHRRVVAQAGPLLSGEDAVGIILLVGSADIHELPLPLVALARRFFLEPRNRRPLRQRGLDLVEPDVARLQQHQQVKQQVGAFGDQMVPIVLDRRDHGLDRFLAQFLGAVLRALVEQFAGVGRLSSRCGPCIDGGGQIVDRKTRHQLNSTLARGLRPRRRPRQGLSTFVTASRQGSSRIGSPARTMCSLACRMVNSPKWNIEAASTAVAWPCRIPSTRWSRLPTPPEAMTGTGTLSAMACVSGRSNPCLVPSRSIEVSRISPAPSDTTSCAYSMASIPVELRPPWVKISQRSPPPARLTRLASIATTMHCSPNFSEPCLTNSRLLTAAELIETLSAPYRSSVLISSMVRTPPPTVSGMKQASAVRRTTSSMVPRFSWVAVMSRKHNSSAPAASYAIAASTGSPASRRSTKLTPLTTLPSFTSRQGMTRTLNIANLLGRGARVADQCQRGGGIEPAVIERAAGNGAGELLRARFQQRLDVLDGCKTAGGDDGDRDALGQRDRRIEVEALQKAVARDVGEDDGGDAGILETLRDLERGHLRGLGPAFDGDLAVAGVEPNRHAAREFLRGALHELRIAHCRGADDDARDAFVEPGFHGLEIANAAAELHRHGDGFQHRLDGQRIHRLAGKGAVEIDDMQIFESLLGERPRLISRIEVEHGRARHVALFEAHALAVFQVDGGKENHGFHFRKFEIRARPKRWLFSG